VKLKRKINLTKGRKNKRMRTKLEKKYKPLGLKGGIVNK
jgi:hypothetical protein